MIDNFDGIIKRYRDFSNRLDSVANIENVEYVSSQDVHRLVVLLLSHPNQPYSNQELLDYVGSKGILQAVATEKIIRAVESLALSKTKILDDKVVYFPVTEAAALLQAMKVEVKLNLKRGETAILPISLASAVDLMYGAVQNIDSRSWINELFCQSKLDVNDVASISPYNQLLILNQFGNQSLVDFLAYRFEKMFSWAKMFLQVVNESTQFNSEVPELVSWINCGRFAMQKDAIIFLPIVNAVQEEFEPVILYFRDPVASLADVISPLTYEDAPKRPYLRRVLNIDDESRRIITNLFFEKIVYPTPLINNKGEIYLLRTKTEILGILNSFSDDDKNLINGLNFLPYLKSMGFKLLELPEAQYLGFLGLQKAVEIHSLSHICFGAIVGDIWPPFVETR